eukprot:CAMPEP_0181498732 /NCGR_PEP_ID=MMETSP1110-20121109/54261_1 /TAXON_ID=174948 /ORGANISM="Symbiodinium sp., Strain CCMP421" /LENGTH=31 /DNA_ID= /DNA_START= /DNA_END= /DNA_ORIENTATION=
MAQVEPTAVSSETRATCASCGNVLRTDFGLQ